jgi:hypothetical protein
VGQLGECACGSSLIFHAEDVVAANDGEPTKASA